MTDRELFGQAIGEAMEKKYGTLDDLITEAAKRLVAEEAAVIQAEKDALIRKILDEPNEDPDVEVPQFERDVTGTLICPGHPKLCLGSGDFQGFPCCCDECSYFLACFPEWEDPT